MIDVYVCVFVCLLDLLACLAGPIRFSCVAACLCWLLCCFARQIQNQLSASIILGIQRISKYILGIKRSENWAFCFCAFARELLQLLLHSERHIDGIFEMCLGPDPRDLGSTRQAKQASERALVHASLIACEASTQSLSLLSLSVPTARSSKGASDKTSTSINQSTSSKPTSQPASE
jgi:hypothetical protein